MTFRYLVRKQNNKTAYLHKFCHEHAHITLCVHNSFSIIWKRNRTLVVAIIVLQVYCYFKCSVALPHVAMDWSAVCDCGIS